MKLLLTSNGFIDSSLEKDFWDLVGNRKNLRVAIIPNASDPIEWVPEKEGDPVSAYVAKLTRPNDEEYGKGKDYRYFKDKGHEVVIADLKEDPMELRKKLESADIIDVWGGDVNWLLDWAKKSKTDTYLKGILSKGVVYVGSSAGSCLLTPDIGLGWWEPDWKLDHVGLGVVDFLISPHNKEADLLVNIEKTKKQRERMQSLMDYPWKIYFLQDGQAIKVDGDKIEHIGEGAKRSI
jgi:dipeptidase E